MVQTDVRAYQMIQTGRPAGYYCQKAQGSLECKTTLRFCHIDSTTSLVDQSFWRLWLRSSNSTEFVKCHHDDDHVLYFESEVWDCAALKLVSKHPQHSCRHTLALLRTLRGAHRTCGFVIWSQRHHTTGIFIKCFIQCCFITQCCILSCFLLISDWRNVILVRY